MNPTAVRGILGNNKQAPEARFTIVAGELFARMSESSNKTVREVGAAMLSFWDNEMERTNIWTPDWEAKDG